MVADGLAQAIEPVMAGDQVAQAPLALLVGAVGTVYTYYADLSGYADIAIGSSLILGMRLSQNFRRPFATRSVTEFWQRWHITVTNWFRDQVYFPLARRNISSLPNRFAAIVLTMVIIGVWHGAKWNWLLVGVISGLLIGTTTLARKWRMDNDPVNTTRGKAISIYLAPLTQRIILWLFIPTLGALVGTESVSVAWQVLARIADLPYQLAAFDASGIRMIPLHIIMAIAVLEIFQWQDERKPIFERLRNAGRRWSWGFYASLMTIIIVFGTYNSPDFLYFQM